MFPRARPTYRSEAGRAALLAVYDRWLALLPAGVGRIEVQTRFGPTNVLVAGPEDESPLGSGPINRLEGCRPA